MLLMNNVMNEHVESVSIDHEFAVVVGDERALLCVDPTMTEHRWTLGDEFAGWWLVSVASTRKQCTFAKTIDHQLHVAVAKLVNDEWTLGQSTSVGAGRLITKNVIAGDSAWIDAAGELHADVYSSISKNGVRVAGRRWRAARVEIDGTVTGLSGDEVVRVAADGHVSVFVGSDDDALRGGNCTVIATEVGDVQLADADGTLNLQLDSTIVPTLNEKYVTPMCRAVTVHTSGVIDLTTRKWTAADKPWGKVLAVGDGKNTVRVLSVDGKQLRLTELTIGGDHVREVDKWTLPAEADDGVVLDSKHAMALVNGRVYTCAVGEKPVAGNAAAAFVELPGENPLLVTKTDLGWVVNGLAMENKPMSRGVRAGDAVIVNNIVFVDNQAKVPTCGVAFHENANVVKLDDQLLLSTGDEIIGVDVKLDDEALLVPNDTVYNGAGKVVAITKSGDKTCIVTWADGYMRVTMN